MDGADHAVDFKTKQNGHVYIYGAGKKGRSFQSLIKNCYDEELSVAGFIDRAATGLVEDRPIYRLSEIQDKSVRIVISVGVWQMAKETHQTLRMARFQDVW